MGRFVEITIGRDRVDGADAQAIVKSCPVDIFTLGESGALRTDPTVEDECILCGACVSAAEAAVTVRQAYGARTPVGPAGDGND